MNPLMLIPTVLGRCGHCDKEVHQGEHFYKQPSGEYYCEDCDLFATPSFEREAIAEHERMASR